MATPLTVDAEDGTIGWGGDVTRAPRAQIKLLNMLGEKPGKMVRQQAMFNRLWPLPDDSPLDVKRNLKVHITGLRRTLEKVGAGVSVVNIHGLGYKLSMDGVQDTKKVFFARCLEHRVEIEEFLDGLDDL